MYCPLGVFENHAAIPEPENPMQATKFDQWKGWDFAVKAPCFKRGNGYGRLWRRVFTYSIGLFTCLSFPVVGRVRKWYFLFLHEYTVRLMPLPKMLLILFTCLNCPLKIRTDFKIGMHRQTLCMLVSVLLSTDTLTLGCKEDVPIFSHCLFGPSGPFYQSILPVLGSCFSLQRITYGLISDMK